MRPPARHPSPAPIAPPVPFYRQSYDFTCGPACLIMAMGRYDPTLEPSRALELDLWREANLVEAYATSRQGLALAAHRRGFRVRTQGTAASIELLDDLGLPLAPSNRKVAVTLHRDLKDRCRTARIRDTLRPVAAEDLERWLARGWTPILLVDGRLVGEEAIPHWIVVSRVSSSKATVEDPLAPRGGTVVGLQRLQRFMGFRGTHCAVVVEGYAGRRHRPKGPRGPRP